MTHWTKQQIRIGLILASMFLIVANIFVYGEILKASGEKNLKIAVLNIGQGDSIYIKAPNGNDVLVDGGPDRKTLSELGAVMEIGDKKIDALFITNPDRDHIAGFIPVLENFSVDFVVEPGTQNSSKVYSALGKTVSESRAKKILAKRGMSFVLDSKNNVHLDVIFPDRDVSNWKTNEGSIIMRLVYGQTSVLLTGDTTEQVEEYLAKNFPNDLRADILKVGHHGSKTSTSKILLETAKPKIAIISAGKNNQYGHPHKEVLDRLAKFGIQTFVTARDGRIVLTSDGLSWQKE